MVLRAREPHFSSCARLDARASWLCGSRSAPGAVRSCGNDDRVPGTRAHGCGLAGLLAARWITDVLLQFVFDINRDPLRFRASPEVLLFTTAISVAGCGMASQTRRGITKAAPDAERAALLAEGESLVKAHDRLRRLTAPHMPPIASASESTTGAYGPTSCTGATELPTSSGLSTDRWVRNQRTQTTRWCDRWNDDVTHDPSAVDKVAARGRAAAHVLVLLPAGRSSDGEPLPSRTGTTLRRSTYA